MCERVITELLQLYWDLGKDILEKQKNTRWGDGFLKQLSQDSTMEFPEMKGFSVRNLQLICKWYSFYNQELIIAKQVVSQLQQDFFSIPWGHHILIMQRSKDMDKALFYIQQTVENNWSRTVLDWQIDNHLYERQGKAISNFRNTLPTPQSDLAQQITKDPYIIDIMGIRQDMEEREIKTHLDAHISQYLIESPIGVSSVQIYEQLTANYKSSLPTIEEIEAQFKKHQ